VPYHINFEEVNLRFYVKYKDGNTWKRGVVFIKEIVPRPALTLVANTFYKENYETMPMAHAWTEEAGVLTTEYKWKKGRWNSFKVVTEGQASPIDEGSEEEFITEHYWGYTKRGHAICSEYGVEHPRWEVYKMIEYDIDVDFAGVYGADMGFLKELEPASVFLAEGSEIMVRKGSMIR
jgi:uncharacterized protein YqjF (DUF2071 family)